jgi:hypothetical protein
MHVFLAIPAAFWLAEHWTAARRIAASAALVIGVGVQLLGCSQDFILYHRVFFLGMRPDTLQISPQINFARVPYDAYDGAMFEQRFQLRAIPPEGGEPVPVRPQYAPAPISSSIYYPPHTVWARYPVMWSELDLIDNLWVRVMRD